MYKCEYANQREEVISKRQEKSICKDCLSHTVMLEGDVFLVSPFLAGEHPPPQNVAIFDTGLFLASTFRSVGSAYLH